MPNHVSNILEFEGDNLEIKKLYENIKCEEEDLGSIDFNKIIPMPKDLEIVSGSDTIKGIELYLTYLNPIVTYFGDSSYEVNKFNKLLKGLNAEKLFYNYNHNMKEDEINNLKTKEKENFDYIFDLGKKAVNNYLNYGATTWYEWSIKNWGTKWNAYHFGCYIPEDNKLFFDTAWSNASPVIQKLSEMYPKILFKYRWADEDIGNNTGRVEYLAGKEQNLFIPDAQSKIAYEMAIEILGLDADEFLYYDEKEGRYKWKDDEGSSEEFEEEDDMENDTKINL